MKMKFRKHFDYDVEEASNEATIKDRGESLTVQSQSEDTDINVMMKRFGVTGQLPQNPRVPTFGDFSGIRDFHSAMEAVVNAEDAFMEFPPDVRARFDNDPQRLLEFVADDKNYAEAIKLGLMKKDAKVPTPVGSGAPPAVPAAIAPGAPVGARAPVAAVAPVVP